jgi:hypothetical protein
MSRRRRGGGIWLQWGGVFPTNTGGVVGGAGLGVGRADFAIAQLHPADEASQAGESEHRGRGDRGAGCRYTMFAACRSTWGSTRTPHRFALCLAGAGPYGGCVSAASDPRPRVPSAGPRGAYARASGASRRALARAIPLPLPSRRPGAPTRCPGSGAPRAASPRPRRPRSASAGAIRRAGPEERRARSCRQDCSPR